MTVAIAIYYNVIVTLVVISHLQSVFTDPGMIPLPSRRHSPNDLLTLKRSGTFWMTFKRLCGYLLNNMIIPVSNRKPWYNEAITFLSVTRILTPLYFEENVDFAVNLRELFLDTYRDVSDFSLSFV
ncbi:hypothetical protein ACTXT7_011679 [Hymenolepis weldensis]